MYWYNYRFINKQVDLFVYASVYLLVSTISDLNNTINIAVISSLSAGDTQAN